MAISGGSAGHTPVCEALRHRIYWTRFLWGAEFNKVLFLGEFNELLFLDGLPLGPLWGYCNTGCRWGKEERVASAPIPVHPAPEGFSA